MKIFLQHLPVPAQILTQNLILCNREESFIIKMAIMHDWPKSWAKKVSKSSFEAYSDEIAIYWNDLKKNVVDGTFNTFVKT